MGGVGEVTRGVRGVGGPCSRRHPAGTSRLPQTLIVRAGDTRMPDCRTRRPPTQPAPSIPELRAVACCTRGPGPRPDRHEPGPRPYGPQRRPQQVTVLRSPSGRNAQPPTAVHHHQADQATRAPPPSHCAGLGLGPPHQSSMRSDCARRLRSPEGAQAARCRGPLPHHRAHGPTSRDRRPDTAARGRHRLAHGRAHARLRVRGTAWPSAQKPVSTNLTHVINKQAPRTRGGGRVTSATTKPGKHCFSGRRHRSRLDCIRPPGAPVRSPGAY
jgi:hypothetical protein